MKPVLISANNESDFGEQKAITENVTPPIPLFRTAAHTEIKNSSIGFWECTPGKFERKVTQAEFSYIIEGEGSFCTDSGEIVEFHKGDSIYFEPNTKGEWNIKETVRKAYFIV